MNYKNTESVKAKTNKWLLPVLFFIILLSSLCFLGFSNPEDLSAHLGKEHYLLVETGAELQSYEPADINCPFEIMASDSRLVTLNEMLLEPGRVTEGDILVIDLGGEKSETAVIDRINTDINGIFSMRGRLKDDDLGYIIISGNDGKFKANIKNYNENKHYVINYNKSTGKHVLHLLNPDKVDFLPGTDPTDYMEGIVLPQEYILPQSLPDIEEDVTVDIMIVYTPAAKEYAEETTGIDTFIAQALEHSQLALDNSNTALTLRLVHSAKVNYNETGSITTDLRRLTNTTSFITEVHDLRDHYGADLVNMFTLEHGSGGHAWILRETSGEPSRAFSITRVQQASWTYTMAHELAHNFGCHHSKYQSVEPGPGIFPHSAGWRWTGDDEEKYASVMAYSEGTYKIVPYFSNPDILYAGAPTGHSLHGDNARTLRQLKSVIAGYRTAQNEPPELKADLIIDIETGNEIEISFEDNPLWRENIASIEVDGSIISADNYSVGEGILIISSDIFQEARDYHIRVTAEGFLDALVTQIISSSEDPIKYTVKFKDWNEEIIHTDIVTHGSAAKAPADPEREGYTFTGWDKDFSIVTENTTVTALYTINQYTLNYIAGDGGSITGETTQLVDHGSDGSEVTAVPEEGYHFVGWSDGLDTESRTDTGITDNLEFTANFAAETYTVIFEDHDGTELKTEVVGYGSSATPPAKPERPGYTFDGWDTNFSNVTSNLTVRATYLIQTEAPLIITEEKSVNKANITVEGTAEPNAWIILTGAEKGSNGHADAEGNFSIEVTLKPDAVNLLSVTAWANGKSASKEATVAITYNAVMGDVDGDGNVTISDAILILRHIVGLIELDSGQLFRAKVNGGEELIINDAIMILRYIVGLTNEL